MKSEVTVYVRPLRHAYFVLADDLERFIEVASFCCTQWGGINNLIVPVSIDRTNGQSPHVHIDRRYTDILSRSDPLFFIDAVSDRYPSSRFLPQVIDQLMAYIKSFDPGAYLQSWEAFTLIDDSLHPLWILPSASSPEQPTLSRAVIPSYQPVTDLERATIVAAFGRIWPDQERDYAVTLDMTLWEASVPDLMLSAQCSTAPSASVINFTLRELHNIGSEPMVYDKHFHVVVVQTCADLCWYWAIRARSFGLYRLYDRHVLVITKDQLFSSSYFDALIRLIRDRHTHPNIESNLHVLFYHDDDDIEAYLSARPELEAHQGQITESMRLFGGNEEQKEQADTLSNSDLRERRLSYVQRDAAQALYLSEVPRYFDYGGHPPTYSLELADGSTTHLLPGFGLQTLRWASVWLSMKGTFLDNIPLSRGIGGLLVPQPAMLEERLNATWLSYRSYLTPGNSERLTITLRLGWELYQAYFGSGGYHVEASDKMPYATGLLELVGGLDHAGALRSQVAYHLLDLLTDRSTKKLAQAVKAQLPRTESVTAATIEQAIAATGVLPRFQRNPKSFTELWAGVKSLSGDNAARAQVLRTLGDLVQIGAVQRGLNVRCPTCGVVNWFGMRVLDEVLTCPGCLTSFPLPLTQGNNLESDRPMEYALNPLANRVMDQDVLPVILALLALKTVHPEMAHVIPGMSFRLATHAHLEGDFDFIYTYKSKVYAGECKAGGMLGDKDITTMQVASSLGARAFYFVSMTSFTEASLNLIRAAEEKLQETQRPAASCAAFVLNGKMLFGNEQLPGAIPR